MTTRLRTLLASEALTAVTVSAFVGTAAAVTAVVPFAIAKLGTPTASLTPWHSLATITVGTLLALGITAAASPKPRAHQTATTRVEVPSTAGAPAVQQSLAKRCRSYAVARV